MPKKLDSLPCRAIGQDVPAQDEDQDRHGDRAEANMGFAAVGVDFRHKVGFRWASSEPYQSSGCDLPVPDGSEDDEKLDTWMYRDTKGEAPSCTQQSISIDDHEGPYPSIGFDLPISDITDDDEASIRTSGEPTSVQLDVGRLPFDLSWRDSSRSSQWTNDPNGLIRACHVSDILAGNGSFLSDSRDFRDGYAFSWKAESIDFFISHNWSTHHKSKLILLKLWFTLHRAVAFAFLACLPVAALIVSGSLPGWPSKRWIPRDTCTWSPLCVLIGTLVFILSMRFDCKLRCMFPWSCGKTETCFYDRVCINQETAELKRAGILTLPAILNASGTLLVIHSQVYFGRLWTCYEFCFFLAQKGPKYVQLFPENSAALYGEVAVAYTVYVLSANLVYLDIFAFQKIERRATHVVTVFDKIVLLGLCCIIFRQAWRWIGSLLSVERQLKELKISECCCFDESDRPLVEGHLVLLAKSKGLVDQHASHEDSLAAFEVFVRNKGTSIISNYGAKLLPYTMIVGVCMASFLDALENLARNVKQGRAANQFTRSFVAQLALPLFVAPITFRAYLHAAVNLRARKGVGWIGLAAMELCLPAVLGYVLEAGDLWEEQVKPYIEVDTAFYIYLGALFIVTTAIYSPFELTRCIGWMRRS